MVTVSIALPKLDGASVFMAQLPDKSVVFIKGIDREAARKKLIEEFGEEVSDAVDHLWETIRVIE